MLARRPFYYFEATDRNRALEESNWPYESSNYGLDHAAYRFNYFEATDRNRALEKLKFETIRI